MTRLIPRSLVNCPYPWESVYYRIPKHLNGNPHPHMNVNWTVKLWIYVLLNFTKLFELKSQIKMYRHSYRDRLHSNPHIQILRTHLELYSFKICTRFVPLIKCRYFPVLSQQLYFHSHRPGTRSGWLAFS